MSALLRATSPARFSPVSLQPLETLLATGGDARLRLDAATGLNVYGCRPAPRPEAVAFSSSTASSISVPAWRRALAAWQRLAAGESADTLVEEVRGDLARVLGLTGTGSAIVFAPSGTDSMLHALAVTRALRGGPQIGVLAAADETGSGVPQVVLGRHFSGSTARGKAVPAGEPIAGLGEGNQLIALRLRDAAGEMRDAAELDREAFAAVARAVAAGRTVLLVAMDHSKLGNRAPSDEGLAEIQAAFGEAVQVVVDACQARLGLGRLRAHLERGRMVLLTGSKFFSGPPLSGALIVPPMLAWRLADATGLPPGLRDYSIASDWPPAWQRMRASLPAADNVGQMLRWTAALAEMEAWFAIPPECRVAMLRGFAADVNRAIAGFDGLDLLATPALADDEFPGPTIFPFFVRRRGQTLSAAACATLHRLLNHDLGAALPSADPRERALAALPCHIGQPVAVSGTDGACGVLRVSAGARIAAASGGSAEALRRVFAKVTLLLRHSDLMV